MSRLQKFILGGFGFITLLILVSGGVVIWFDISKVGYLPTETLIVMPASFIETSTLKTSPIEFHVTPSKQPTSTTRIMLPTWTPIPTNTPIPSFTAVVSKTTVPTPRKVAATSAPKTGGSYCSAQYKYIEELHQYYLDYINYTYSQEMSYYESLLQEAVRLRDAREVIRLQQDIDRIKANRDNAINSENSRYAADRAYLDSQCK